MIIKKQEDLVVKVYPAYDSNKFVIVSQNELDNILSQCKIREDYKPTIVF